MRLRSVLAAARVAGQVLFAVISFCFADNTRYALPINDAHQTLSQQVARCGLHWPQVKITLDDVPGFQLFSLLLSYFR